MLVRSARIVPVGGAAVPDAPVDLRIEDGSVSELGTGLVPGAGEEVLDADGRWAVPGLWDHHVHWTIWAQALTRVDTSGTQSPSEVTRRVAEHTTGLDDPTAVVMGYGHRSATWATRPTVAELDAVSGDHPVVLISGDGHNGWLNSRALGLLGAPRTGFALSENDWFPVYSRLKDLPGADDPTDAVLRAAMEQAASRGVVGIVDLDFGTPFVEWPERVRRGMDLLRVRTGVYAERLEQVVDAGWRTGTPLDERGLVTMGPLKIISDGSLNTRTAWSVEPYADAAVLEHPYGQANLTEQELEELVSRAHEHGLEVAVHAIGDAAVGQALDVIEAVGASGSIEHAQLTTYEDVRRLGRLPLRASVQPAHLLDDRDVTHQCWPGQADRSFMLRSLLEAGATLAFGSDAPVSPLDPWLEMAAAVHRTGDDREEWNPDESLTADQALAASVDGQPALRVGSRGDVVLLDVDPLAPGSSAEVAARLRARPVAATLLGGRVTHLGL